MPEQNSETSEQLVATFSAESRPANREQPPEKPAKVIHKKRYFLGNFGRALFGGVSNQPGGSSGSFYDGAADSESNRQHFRQADDRSANAHADPWARKILRERSRYEVANNGWLMGMGKSWANDVIGTTPRVQVLIPLDMFDEEIALLEDPDYDEKSEERFQRRKKVRAMKNRRVAEEVETKFGQWMRDNEVAEKMRMQVISERNDGEGICILFKVPEADYDQYPNPIKLGYRELECDRLTDPNMVGIGGVGFDDRPNYIDGVHVNDYGDPVKYDFLARHPGAADALGVTNDVIEVDAKWVFHLFERTRPEQHRGVPTIQASLVPASLLRQYSVAVVKAARNAARMNGVIESEAPVDEEYDEYGNTVKYSCEMPDPGDAMSLRDDEFIFLPNNLKINPVKGDHPHTNHEQFVKVQINEMARPGCMPYFKAAGNAADYNYASGRLDHQDYRNCLKVKRFNLENKVLDRIFAIWWDEAIRTEGYLTRDARNLIGIDDYPPTPNHKWHWDGFPHVDPLKEAKAQTEMLRAGTDNLINCWARQGKDWNRELDCAAMGLGVTREEYLSLVRQWTYGSMFAVPVNEANPSQGSAPRPPRPANEQQEQQVETQLVLAED